MKGKTQRNIIILIILSGGFLVIGFFSDLLISMILYLLVILTYIGIKGGSWLWVRLASSPSFKKGIPWYIKMIGLIAISIFMVILVGGVKIFLVNNPYQINRIIDAGTKLMFFLAFYNIGYLISIWNLKIGSVESKNPLNVSFKIKKRLTILVISIILIWIILSLIIGFSIDRIWFSDIFKYLAMAGISLGLGWIFWQHLKELNMLSGTFLKYLKLFSILFEIPIIILTILGIYFMNAGLTLYNQFLLLGYLLLFYLITMYFIGLLYETIKK